MFSMRRRVLEDYTVKKYVICYFDILGYKQMLDKLGDDKYIHYIVCVIDTLKALLDDEVIVPFNYHIFSDNIIIFAPIQKDDFNNTVVISEFVRCISILQRNLMGQYSIFIRGCITLGNLYYDGKFVYGSGLVKAYNLENEKAIYPRIILDEQCVRLCCDNNEILWGFIFNWYVREDVDGCYFLNYLCDLRMIGMNNSKKDENSIQIDAINTSEFIELPDSFCNIDFSGNKEIEQLFDKYFTECSSIGLNYLLLHKVIVERNIAVAKSEKIKKKYIWCKIYHNEVCKANDIPELIINQ